MRQTAAALAVLCGWGLLATGCSTTSENPFHEEVREARAVYPQGVYFLRFDRDGFLTDPAEVARAIAEIRAQNAAAAGGVGRPVERIMVVSLGWGIFNDASPGAYLEYILDYTGTVAGEAAIAPDADTNSLAPRLGAGAKGLLDGVAVFCVIWDSSQQGLRRLLGDLIPTPAISNTLGLVPDLALFPVSYWAKSALADRVGYAGLKDALELVLDDETAFPDDDRPPIYLIGYSFGARILSGFAQQRLGAINVPERNAFKYADDIRGAVFILPAAVELNLPQPAVGPGMLMARKTLAQEFPIVVVQSRHDHANGFLFPIANAPLNAYLWTLAEGGVLLSRHRHTRLSPFRRFTKDLLRVPTSIVLTAGLVPANYLYGQVFQLWRRHLNYPFDTLAQLPGAEIAVWGLEKGVELTGYDPAWGEQHKGVFAFGALNESVTRARTPLWGTWPSLDDHYVIPIEVAIRENHLWDDASGIFYVDASPVLSKSLYGPDLANPLTDFTLGWLDPVGTHTRFTSTETHCLVFKVLLETEPDAMRRAAAQANLAALAVKSPCF